jgi:hypothetical protein
VPALDQQNYITQITARLADDQRIRALLLSGSFGRGTADAYSDVDLLALIARDSQEAVMSGWRETLETIAPIVYFNRLPFAPVLNAITDAWLRCDLQVQPVTETRGLTQDRYKVLIDRDGIYPALPATSPLMPTEPRQLAGIVSEFIRILGLLHVADGRREYELATTGTGMMRGLLTNLLILEMERGDQGGMLHLSRKIDAARMQLLLDLPVAAPDRATILVANAALAKAFFPRAKSFAQHIGMPWPADFEAATRAKLTADVRDGDWNW